jgi:hypothetical protein
VATKAMTEKCRTEIMDMDFSREAYRGAAKIVKFFCPTFFCLYSL